MVSVSIELLLCVAYLIAQLCFTITLIWATSSNSRKSRFVNFLTTLAATAIEVGLLIVHCLAGKEYGIDLFFVAMWLCGSVLSAYKVRKEN